MTTVLVLSLYRNFSGSLWTTRFRKSYQLGFRSDPVLNPDGDGSVPLMVYSKDVMRRQVDEEKEAVDNLQAFVSRTLEISKSKSKTKSKKMRDVS